MRLDQLQKKALKIALQNLQGIDKVFLFGSRVDDTKRSGDIDLLIYSQQPDFELIPIPINNNGNSRHSRNL